MTSSSFLVLLAVLHLTVAQFPNFGNFGNLFNQGGGGGAAAGNNPLANLNNVVQGVQTGVAAGTDAACKPKFEAYRKCLSDASKPLVQAIDWSAVQQCFTDQGCPAPDQDNVLNTIKQSKGTGLDNLDDYQVGNCAADVFNKDKSNLQKCTEVSRNHPWMTELPTLDDYEKKGVQIITAAKSIKVICYGDASVRDAVRNCLASNPATDLHAVRNGMCKANTDCKPGLTQTCQTEADGLSKKLCECARTELTANHGQRMNELASCLSDGQQSGMSPAQKQSATAILDQHSCDEASPDQVFDKVCASDDDWNPPASG